VMALSVGDSSVKLLNEKQNRRVTKHLTNNIKSEVTQVMRFYYNFRDFLTYFNVFICK